MWEAVEALGSVDRIQQPRGDAMVEEAESQRTGLELTMGGDDGKPEQSVVGKPYTSESR
jgi:hypothetical protein